MRIAVLVKQIPTFEEMTLGPDGRLRRDGVELEMNPYCRRAVGKAAELAGERRGASVTVLTLGPPAAEDTLREAVAWGLARGVETDALHLCDPAFAGSDTLATARALAAALRREGPYDLILAGRNSVDADTGQVGPEVAELLDLPFAAGVRHLTLAGDVLDVRCEHDDGWLEARLRLPALLSCAERLCEPSKVEPDGRAAVPAERIRRLTAADLGSGPWGQAASPTTVGPVTVVATERRRHLLPDAPLDRQVREAVRVLVERGALDAKRDRHPTTSLLPAAGTPGGAAIAVTVEPGRERLTRELLGAAARLAAAIGGRVVAIGPQAPDPVALGSWGADEALHVTGADAGTVPVEEDVAAALAAWAAETAPWAVLAPGTSWGREVASRAAARLGAGLVGDAVGLEERDGRLVASKPAFGGQLVAEITTASPTQMVTVRAGVLPTPLPRASAAADSTLAVATRGRVYVRTRTREDDLDLLADAPVVVAVGLGVDPSEYGALEPLLALLGAELGATRKVTDRGWLPRSRQIGITGRSVAARLVVSIGASGGFTHVVGLRAAGTVLAINAEGNAPVFDAADAGVVGNWRVAVPLLVAEIRGAPESEPARPG